MDFPRDLDHAKAVRAPSPTTQQIQGDDSSETMTCSAFFNSRHCSLAVYSSYAKLREQVNDGTEMFLQPEELPDAPPDDKKHYTRFFHCPSDERWVGSCTWLPGEEVVNLQMWTYSRASGKTDKWCDPNKTTITIPAGKDSDDLGKDVFPVETSTGLADLGQTLTPSKVGLRSEEQSGDDVPSSTRLELFKNEISRSVRLFYPESWRVYLQLDSNGLESLWDGLEKSRREPVMSGKELKRRRRSYEGPDGEANQRGQTSVEIRSQ